MRRGTRIATLFAIALFILAEAAAADTAAPTATAPTATTAPTAGAAPTATAAPDSAVQPARARSFRLPVPSLAGTMFRFLPDGEWREFDRPLRLTAAPGEERLYSLELRDSSGTRRADYLVDRLAPPVPQPDPAPGSYAGPLTVQLSGEAGSAIAYSLSGPGIDFAAPALWNPERPLVLPASADRTGTWVLVAQATDSSGNESPMASYVYTIMPQGLPATGAAAFAPPQPPRLNAAFDPGIPAIETGDSSATLRFAVPNAGQLVAAVGAGQDVGRAERWQALEVDGRLAVLRLQGPYGWSADLSVSIGVLKDGVISYWPTPYVVHLAPLSPAAATTLRPEAPSLIAGEPGSSSLIVFPPYDGDIYYSLDGGKETLWRGPIPLAAGRGQVLIAWKGQRAGYTDSDSSTMRLDRPPLLPERLLLGLDGPAVRADAFKLSAAPGVTLRYELAEGPVFPAAVTSSSTLLAGDLAVDTPPGTDRIVTIRYRAYSDASALALGGEEGFARLTVDRKPPSPPKLLTSLPSFSRLPVSIALEAEGGSRIMVELEDGSGRPKDSEVRGSVLLGAQGTEARSWRLRAWAVDEAGNVSARIGPYACVVDPVGLYVDQGAPQGGNGDPAKPFATIEAALAAARGDEVVLRVRSGYGQTTALAIDRPSLKIVSGASLAWLWPDTPQQGIVNFPRAAPGTSAISVGGARLGFYGLDARFGGGEGEAIAIKGGGFEAVDSLISASTSKTLSLIDAASAKVDLRGVFLKLGGTGGGADLVARDSSVTISDSDLGATGTTAWLSCLSIKGGSLRLRASRVGASAGISSVGLSAEAATLSIDRLQLELSGSAGYRRGAIIDSSSGRVVNSHIVSSGPPTTLVELRDAKMSFLFDSFIDSAAPKGSLVFSVRGALPLLVDDLFLAKGGARLFDSDRPPEKGGIGACAFAGFGPLVTGAVTLGSVSSLPVFDSTSNKGASIDLGLAPVLRVAPKGGYEVLPGSPIVDAGIPFGPAETAHDFSGLPRPSTAGNGLPDIGADELR